MDDRSIEVLLGKVAHELRNPANAIAGWVRMLRHSPPDDATLSRGLESIDRNVRLQVLLLDDLLDFAGLASGKLRLRFEPFDLERIVDEAVDNILPDAASRDIAVVAHRAETPMLVHADKERMLQVFGNILTNAVKFTPSGGRVDLRFESVGGATVRATVTDTGRGIPAENLDTIFELFHQGTSAHPAGLGGLGIGLAVVRQIVEQHGGNVSAWSDGTGMGSTFVVDLPASTEA
jgi:signal transduction histidine kinase